jgi:hypothetical protein
MHLGCGEIEVTDSGPSQTEMAPPVSALGACAAEGVKAKRVGKGPGLSPLLRPVAVATAGKTGAKWDFSPGVAADALLPRRLLVLLQQRTGFEAARFNNVLIPVIAQLRGLKGETNGWYAWHANGIESVKDGAKNICDGLGP